MTNRLTALSLAALATASLPAMDIEQAQGGLVIGNDNAKSQSFSWYTALANKQIDQGWARSNDAVLQTGGTARMWGLGLSLDGAFAVGQEKAGAYASAQDPTKYTARSISPGELIEVDAKLDFVFQIDGVYGEGQPFLQLIPHVEKIVYPNQPSNDLNDSQTYLGTDLWWSSPIEGVDIGGAVDWNIQDAGFRGAFGGRELFQFAPYDLSFWQVLNFGDASYRSGFVDTDKRGWTTSQIGAKVMIPSAWREWWTYAKADWTYWLKSDDRDFRSTVGQDAGDLAFAIGIEWRSE